MTQVSVLAGLTPYASPDTTDLTSLLGHVSRETQKLLRKALPAKISAVLSGNRVDVTVGFQAKYNDGSLKTLPIIPNVPVCQPQGQGYAIRLPVAVGDNGLLIIADRCIDPWLAGDGSPADPGDPRLHDLTDAIFIPGILTDAPAVLAGDTGGDLVVQNGAATLHVQKAGTYRIANDAAELVDLTQQLAAATAQMAMAAAQLKLVGSAAVSPDSIAALNAASAKVAPLAAKIATLRGK